MQPRSIAALRPDPALRSQLQWLLWAMVAIALLTGCGREQETSEPPTPDAACTATAPEVIDPADWVSFQYAQGVDVTYGEGYKLVTVRQPQRDSDVTWKYLLVQCGAAIPEGYDDAQVISIPVSHVVALSTTYLPHFDKLGVVDKLAGVDNFKRVNTPSVLGAIARGKLIETGSDASVNVELLLAERPDLVFAYGVSDPGLSAHTKLLDAGLPVAVTAEYLETTPLGRAEWLKFTALFFNKEAEANQLFEDIAKAYKRTAALARRAKQRPKVMVGYAVDGVWYVPGGNSYAAQYLKDAGAEYPWAETETTGSLPLDVEAVFDRAADAKVWLNGDPSWQTLADVRTADSRYANFDPMMSGQVFIPNARLNAHGGNDYWESGVVNPHVVLADLVSILHPDLLSDRELVYYRQLTLSETP